MVELAGGSPTEKATDAAEMTFTIGERFKLM